MEETRLELGDGMLPSPFERERERRRRYAEGGEEGFYQGFLLKKKKRLNSLHRAGIKYLFSPNKLASSRREFK